MRFEGTKAYVATDDLKVAVNAAITLERPLLVKGEPGTGKTVLALEIAKALGAPLIEWHVKSTTKAQQGLYEYDAVSRLRDSQLGDERVKDIRNYIKRGKLWDAFVADERPVLLIDEIDKADIEFPNDLLLELDRMEFFVYETGETVKARRRPIVIITSNNEKELPDAFLRRCFFHYIRFPDADTMSAIVEVHFPGIKQRLVREALKLFYEIRDVPGLKKKPSTSELLDWLKLLMVEDIGPEILRERDPEEADPAAARRAAEERAGRASVRAAGVHGAARRALVPAHARGNRRRLDPSLLRRKDRNALGDGAAEAARLGIDVGRQPLRATRRAACGRAACRRRRAAKVAIGCEGVDDLGIGIDVICERRLRGDYGAPAGRRGAAPSALLTIFPLVIRPISLAFRISPPPSAAWMPLCRRAATVASATTALKRRDISICAASSVSPGNCRLRLAASAGSSTGTSAATSYSLTKNFVGFSRTAVAALCGPPVPEQDAAASVPDRSVSSATRRRSKRPRRT